MILKEHVKINMMSRITQPSYINRNPKRRFRHPVRKVSLFCQVTDGIFKGLMFYGKLIKQNSEYRIVNTETIGHSYPVKNCKLLN